MIKTTQELLKELKCYSKLHDRIRYLVNNNILFPIIRGLYETDPNVKGYYLASAIISDSYISYEFAMSYYGLIPENQSVITCATYGKDRIKRYKSDFGEYEYRNIPKDILNLSVNKIIDNGYVINIASLEKALCDKLHSIQYLHTKENLTRYLNEELKVNKNVLLSMDKKELKKISSKYKCKNVRILCRLLEVD